MHELIFLLSLLFCSYITIYVTLLRNFYRNEKSYDLIYYLLVTLLCSLVFIIMFMHPNDIVYASITGIYFAVIYAINTLNEPYEGNQNMSIATITAFVQSIHLCFAYICNGEWFSFLVTTMVTFILIFFIESQNKKRQQNVLRYDEELLNKLGRIYR